MILIKILWCMFFALKIQTWCEPTFRRLLCYNLMNLLKVVNKLHTTEKKEAMTISSILNNPSQVYQGRLFTTYWCFFHRFTMSVHVTVTAFLLVMALVISHTWTKRMALNCSKTMNDSTGDPWPSEGGATFWWIRVEPWKRERDRKRTGIWNHFLSIF